MVLVGHPVEAQHAGVPVGARPGNHDVVPALGIEVVVAAVADEHVVSAVVQVRVVEHGVAHVALHQVGAAAALEPVVAFVPVEDVGTGGTQQEVVSQSAVGGDPVLAAEHEVDARTAKGAGRRLPGPGSARRCRLRPATCPRRRRGR